MSRHLQVLLSDPEMELSARDAVHIAIMERHGIRSLLSFDSDFDRRPGLLRVNAI